MDVVQIHPQTLYDEDNDGERYIKHNKDEKVLEEDQDQGEMDMIFWGGLAIITIVLSTLSSAYPENEDYEAVGKFALIMSNLWAFFPIMQAQGLWLKILLIGTCWYSILWHWTQVEFPMPGSWELYGTLDTMFSCSIITAYALSWLPKIKTFRPTPEDERGRWGWFYKSCRGPPKETSEWRCRWTPNLIINMFVCFGLMLYFGYHWPTHIAGVDAALVVCWTSISVAFIIAIWHLWKGKMKVGYKFRKNFVFWLGTGMIFGSVAFVYKSKSNARDRNRWVFHSTWHIYVFSCAYCFSRAQEYLEIY
tara:strand:+ start:815 stop:1732 length:918 start_codon:yes stop_codon:yes gene_type:complete